MTTFADPASPYSRPTPPPTVMRGPANADNYRVKVGRYGDRWYRDPLPYCPLAAEALSDESYPSVSIVKGASGKDWSYVTMKRIAHANLHEIVDKGYFERYERLKVINQLDLSAASRRGTNVHTWAECLAYGVTPTLTPRDEGSNYFGTVTKFFADYQPRLVAAEFVAIHRTLNGVGYGGTGDGIFEIDGKLYIVDWKSRGEDSDHGAYPEEAGQLGAYMGGQYVIVEDSDPANPHGAKRTALPELAGGLIVSIKPDSYEVYPVDRDKAIEHFASMHAWWVARTTESKVAGHKWAPRVSQNSREGRQESSAEQRDRGSEGDSTPTGVSPEVDDSRGEKPSSPDTYEQAKQALYARHDALTDKQKAEFADRVHGIDTTDLDAVEALLNEIEHPPSLIEMAQERMEADRRREADRQLSVEGGIADPDDHKLLMAGFDLALTDEGRQWVGQRVAEAEQANVSFRLSELDSQRRIDLYLALVEWAANMLPDADPAWFRGALAAAQGPTDLSMPIGALVGSMTTQQAALLRLVVTEIVAGRMALAIADDGTARWERGVPLIAAE